MFPFFVSALFALSACKPSADAPLLGGYFEDGVAVAVQVLPSVGVAPHRVQLRRLNAWGASVSSEPTRVFLDALPVEVSWDGLGYGEVLLERPGATLFEFEGMSRTLQVYASGTFELPMMPASAPIGSARFVQAATNGQLVGAGQDLYWVQPGQVPYSVAHFPSDPVGGVSVAHLNEDGFLDALVWAGDTVLVLRGREGGGLAAAGGFRTPGEDVRGAAAANFVGNIAKDVLIAWSSSEQAHHLQLWEGDGQLGFVEHSGLTLSASPTSLTVGDGDGDRAPEVSLLTEGNGWTRLAFVNGRFTDVGPYFSDTVESGTLIRSGVDMNGDQRDELFLLSPRADGLERSLRIYDLGVSVDQSVEYIPVSYNDGAYFGFGDANADAIEELYALEGDGRLFSLAWNGSEYSQRTTAQLGDHGPFDLGRVGDVSTPQLFLAGGAWSWWPGQTRTLDGVSWWEVNEPTSILINPADIPTADGTPFLFQGPIANVDFDGDPRTMEVMSFGVQGLAFMVKVWRLNAGNPPSIQQIRSMAVSEETVLGLEIEVCEGFAYVLTESKLARIELDGWTLAAMVPSSAERLSCGQGPEGSVVALLDSGRISLLDANLNELSAYDSPRAQDLAIGRLDGQPMVAECEDDGCEIVFWPYGPAHDAFVRTTPSAISVDEAGTTTAFSGGGRPNITDVNGDGFVDLVVVGQETTVSFFPSTGESFGLGPMYHTRMQMTGPAIIGDATGDGKHNLILSGGERGLFLAVGEGL